MLASYPVKINGKTHLFSRRTKQLSSIDLLDWLESIPLFPKFFWNSKSCAAAAGKAASWEECPVIEEDSQEQLRLYGGRRFSKEKRKESCWDAFPSSFFFLPAFELRAHEESFELAANALDTTPPEIPELPSAFLYSDKEVAIAREETPEYPYWKTLVEKALSSNAFRKVVLARKTSLQFSETISGLSLLKAVKEKTKAKTSFAFQPCRGQAFIGATPEKLFERSERTLATDVVAGTFTDESDAKDPKLQREFLYVKDYLRETLSSLCVRVSCEKEDSAIPAYKIFHLYNRFTGTLLPEVTDAHLLEALHPTPAIGGCPKETACRFIDKEEPFERGWYSAPIGWMSRSEAEFAVAIRSALVQEKKLHLFAGVGLVEGSDPLQEWEELERKIGLFTSTTLA